MKKPTPNYKIMLDSAVYALQQAYRNYKQAIFDNLAYTWFDNNGVLTVPDGAESRNQKIEDLKCEVIRLKFKVDEIKAESGIDEQKERDKG